MRTSQAIRLAAAVVVAGLTVPNWCPAVESVRSAPGQERARIALPPASARPSGAVALLVGIDRYAPGSEPAESPLRGCVNDARAVERVLLDRFEFSREDVLVLLDEQATHEGIVRAFCEHLLARSGQGTEALFYFSGHGSRAPDLSGDEGENGEDSTYLAYDSRAGDRAGEHDISDDELGALVAELARRGARVTVVTDSCHSGGGLRGAGPRALSGTRSVSAGVRGIEPEALDGALAFFPRELELFTETARRLPDGAVHLAACADRELAQEVEVEDEDAPGGRKNHGALTWALLESLEHAGRETTYEALANEVAARMSFTAPGQSTWAEGELDRVLFGSGARALPGYACSQRGGALLVRAGWLMGLTRGSLLSVLDGSGERVLGRARVEAIFSTSAAARWEEQPAVDLPPVMRVVEVERGAGLPQLALHVEQAEDARLFVGREGFYLRGELEEHAYVFRRRDGEAELATSEGLVLWRGGVDAGTAELPGDLLELVERERRYQGLARLAHDSGRFPVSARFRDPTPDELARIAERTKRDELRSAEIEPVDGALGLRQRAVGGPDRASWRLAMLELENPHARTLHVAVLSMEEDRTIELHWPERNRRDNLLEQGQKKTLAVGVVARPDWPLERAMQDRYLIVSTAKYADLSVFSDAGRVRGAGAGDLPEVLALTLVDHRGASARVGRDTWGITMISLVVEAE